MSYQYLIFPFDYLILCLSILFILFSFWKGFINSLLGLLTWVGSIIITIYSYNSLSNFISKQMLKIELFQNFEQVTNIIAFIISIPLIFLISLFILKKIRKVLSSDLDKQILGIIFDKFFGLIYGLIFSYIVFSTMIYFFESFEYLNLLYYWSLDNSYILESINTINKEIHAYFFIVN